MAGVGRAALGGSNHASVAHVLRRMTFGPFPGGVEGAVDRHRDADTLTDALLEAEVVPMAAPMEIHGPLTTERREILSSPAVLDWWYGRMSADDTGLHDRMMWFWHTLFTTSAHNLISPYMWQHLHMIHTHALGNYRQLAQAYLKDVGMIHYLNGNESLIFAPNENLSRELMELFMLGRGNYTELDVQAGARALSGWAINDFEGAAVYRPEFGPRDPDTFLGTTAVFNTDKVVDVILEQPAAAPHLVSKLWDYFIGSERDDALIAEWAEALRADDWEIRPLVARIVRSDPFDESRFSRPRSGLEWLVPACRAAGIRLDYMTPFASIGQVPFAPPNVAGWPGDARWLTPGSLLARASFLAAKAVPPEGWSSDADMVDDALVHAGIWEVTDETRAWLEEFRTTLKSSTLEALTPENRQLLMLRAVLLTPEFCQA